MKITFSNQNGIELSHLAALCGGRCIGGESGARRVLGLCTDSREADAQTAFVAMRGERVDGHGYIAAAIQNGCPAVICERVDTELEQSGVSFILVKDSERSLSQMAGAYRKALPFVSVGVTGSVGKTTAKEMITRVLERSKRVYSSKGNY